MSQFYQKEYLERWGHQRLDYRFYCRFDGHADIYSDQQSFCRNCQFTAREDLWIYSSDTLSKYAGLY